MSIVTKTGDSGQTTGPQGRVSKSSQFAITTGALDELQANLGLVYERTKTGNFQERELLLLAIEELYTLQSDLYLGRNSLSLNIAAKKLEDAIFENEKRLPPLTNFIRPIGSILQSQLHIARTVCRRAERELIKYYEQTNSVHVDYSFINRLSDYLFTLSRYLVG